MLIRCAALFVSAFLVSSPSLAEPAAAAPAVKRERAERRVERHDRRQALVRKTGGRVFELDIVEVRGRRQRPLAAVETSVQEFRFPLGTARYSERDKRFLRSARGERW